MVGVAADFESERFLFQIDTRFAECGPRGEGVAPVGLEGGEVEQGERVPAGRGAAKGGFGLGRSAEIVQRNPGEPIRPGMITFLGVVSDEIGIHQKVVVGQLLEPKFARYSLRNVGVSKGLCAQDSVGLAVGWPERTGMPGGGKGADPYGDLSEFKSIVGDLVEVSQSVADSPPTKLKPREPGAGDRVGLSLETSGGQ
jgi:hypothetical protein